MNDNRLVLYLILGISSCFVSSAVAREAIIGGIKAKLGQFPYQVAITDPEIGLVCGGTIIREQFVLTAAHCVVQEDGSFRGKHVKVVAGTINVLKPFYPALTIAVKKIYIPVEYTPSLVKNTGELAVLKLQYPLPFSRNINKTDLPGKQHKQEYHKPAIIAGFGWDKVKIENDRAIRASSNYNLLYTESDVLTEQVQGELPERYIMARTHQFVVYPSQSRGRDRSTCVGDMGSPLVQNHQVIGVLINIPDKCSETKTASIYARVTHYLNFIDDAINDRNHMFMRAYILIP